MSGTFAIAAALLIALTAPAGAQTATAGQPIRTLVYSFSYGSQNTVTTRDSANQAETLGDPHSGMANQYSGALGDRGTMTVDVLREQPDRGLVVTIAEQGENTRSAPAAICVVYGNTNVICDPNKTVNPEEYTLLRFLGSNFVDPTHIDEKGHWGIDESHGGMTVKAGYAIARNDDGIMTIDETRSIRNAHQANVTTDVQTQIGYDYTRLVPTAIKEYVTQRQDRGVGGTSVTIYQTVLKLVSDSMASKGKT
jgi:hypothetical protein